MSKQDAKAKRLAEQLRANLQKRKQTSRKLVNSEEGAQLAIRQRQLGISALVVEELND